MTNLKTKNKKQAKNQTVISWTNKAWDDYLSWQNEDKKILNEINILIEECLRNPFKGTGKPEPLKGDLTGFWSRRITREHRLIYFPENGVIHIISCRFHY